MKFIFLAIVIFAQTLLWADDDLHEGQKGFFGYVYRPKTQLLSSDLKLNFTLLPIPGAGKISGQEVQLRIVKPIGDESITIDKARFDLIRWGHFQTLGIGVDKSLGTPLDINAIKVRLPFVIKGEVGEKDWAIVHTGAGLGYRKLKPESGAKVDASGATVELMCRIDGQYEIADRVQVRPFAEIMYVILAGSKTDEKGNSSATFQQMLQLEAGVGLWIDISKAAPFRIVSRTNPATGEVTYRKIMDEGKRMKIGVVDASVFSRPVDTMTTIPFGYQIKSGFGMEF